MATQKKAAPRARKTTGEKSAFDRFMEGVKQRDAEFEAARARELFPFRLDVHAYIVSERVDPATGNTIANTNNVDSYKRSYYILANSPGAALNAIGRNLMRADAVKYLAACDRRQKGNTGSEFSVTVSNAPDFVGAVNEAGVIYQPVMPAAAEVAGLPL